MSQAELLSVLNSVLQNKEVALQANQKGNKLTVVLNRLTATTDIDYECIAQNIISKLKELSLDSVDTVQFYSRKKGSKQVEWQQSHSLSHSIKQKTPAASPIVSAVTQKASTHSSNHESSMSEKASPLQTFFHRFRLFQETIGAIALVGIFSILAINTLAGQKAQAASWEYEITSVADLSFDEKMDELGKEGWEFVFARRARDPITEDYSYECIFKRRK
ncbi:MAG: hypothetical protein AAFY72_18465 [Cyanobacteria bacterium J06649_4]